VVPLNQWTFLAATYDGSTIKMYVNGNLVASQSNSGTITTTTNPLTIGGDWSGEMFTGKIDNIRIYNTALSQSAIKTDMNTPIGSTPSVTSVAPASSATNVAISTSVTATFNEGLNASTVTTSTVQLTDATGKVVASTVSYNATNNTVTLTPTSPLSNNLTYSFTIFGGVNGVKDANGNTMASNFTSTFTTAPVVTPSVSSVTPANGATGVAVNSTIALTFNEALNPATVTTSTVQLLDANNNAVAESVSYNSTNNTVTVTPASYLQNNATYTVLVHGGSSGSVIQDPAGHNMTANYSSSFTTIAPVAVSSVSPTNGGTNVATGTTVTITFNQALDPTTVTTSSVQLLDANNNPVAETVNYSSTNDTVTITPSTVLGNSTTYKVVVHGGNSGAVVKDAVDRALSANFSSTFTTAAVSSAFPNNSNPPPLPAPTGTVVNVSTVSQLQSAVANLQSGETILIAPGTYNLTGTLYVPQNLTNIAIRGATGKSSDVVIKGDAVLDTSAPYSGSDIWGSGSGISGSIPFGIWLGNVQSPTIGDITLENFVDDAIILNAGVQSPLIHDVVMLDTGEQLLKSNPNGSGGGVNNGVVEYCTIGYTFAAPNNYTNGVDVHTGQNLIIRNNVFKNILTTNPLTTTNGGALAGPAVLFWNGSKNATTVANLFINCQREIAYGLSDPSTITDDNTGGLIANNMIYRSGTQHGDVAIGVWNSPGTEVAYNTVILNGDFAHAIEYRFSTTTNVQIVYNLTDAAIVSRDGATGTVTGNVTNAQPSWFVNESIGDLNLTSAATGAIGQGVYLPEVSTDYNGNPRHSNGPTSVGADEY
jgi:methionine-rich copper-binding protein CopC